MLELFCESSASRRNSLDLELTELVYYRSGHLRAVSILESFYQLGLVITESRLNQLIPSKDLTIDWIVE